MAQDRATHRVPAQLPPCERPLTQARSCGGWHEPSTGYEEMHPLHLPHHRAGPGLPACPGARFRGPFPHPFRRPFRSHPERSGITAGQRSKATSYADRHLSPKGGGSNKVGGARLRAEQSSLLSLSSRPLLRPEPAGVTRSAKTHSAPARVSACTNALATRSRSSGRGCVRRHAAQADCDSAPPSQAVDGSAGCGRQPSRQPSPRSWWCPWSG